MQAVKSLRCRVLGTVLVMALLSACTTASSSTSPMVGQSFTDCHAVCPEMVVIPAGRFMMGSSDTDAEGAANERPQHEVVIAQAFAMGRYEVTRAQFARFVRATQRDMHRCAGENQPWSGKWDHEHDYVNPGFNQTDHDPVVCVSWDDADEYAQWLSMLTGHRYRLPSETEWEYAARAGSRTARYWGEVINEQCRYGNGQADVALELSAQTAGIAQCNDGFRFTAPVGSFRANAFGLYDMLGNAMEWVADCGHASHAGALSDGKVRPGGDCANHIIRGGSWRAEPRQMRATYRYPQSNVRVYVFGLRLVREL